MMRKITKLPMKGAITRLAAEATDAMLAKPKLLKKAPKKTDKRPEKADKSGQILTEKTDIIKT